MTPATEGGYFLLNSVLIQTHTITWPFLFIIFPLFRAGQYVFLAGVFLPFTPERSLEERH